MKAYALISHQIRGHHDTELGNFLHQDEHRNSTTYSDNAGLHDGQDQSAGLLQAKLLATSVLINKTTRSSAGDDLGDQPEEPIAS